MTEELMNVDQGQIEKINSIVEQNVANFLDHMRSLIITNRNYITTDYNLVSTYINGVFRSTPMGQFSFFNSQTFEGRNMPDNSLRYVERWDTTASTVSQNTSSRFRQALLPDGLDSFSVELQGINAPEINEYFTKVLRDSWEYDTLNQIDLAVADYMNYGTAIMTCFGRHADINTSGFYEIQDENGNWARAFLLNEFTFYNNYAIGDDCKMNNYFGYYFQKKELQELPILVVEPGFIESYKRLKAIKGMYRNNLPTCGVFHQLPAHKKGGQSRGWVEYDRSYLYEHLYIARMGTMRRGYGTGCGVNALGSVIDANYVLGTRYLNLERINNPSWIMMSGVEVTRRDGETGIDTRPGGLTYVRPPLGVPATLDQMLQRDQQAQIEFSAFVPLREEFLKELDAAYNAFLFRPYEPVPGSATATGALIQLEDTINAYRAKADSFLNCILIPLAEQKLRNALALKMSRILISKNKEEKEFQGVLEGLKTMGIDWNQIVKINIKDFAYVRRRQAKAMEIQEEMNLISMAAQFMQMDENLAKSMLKKISGLYK